MSVQMTGTLTHTQIHTVGGKKQPKHFIDLIIVIITNPKTYFGATNLALVHRGGGWGERG